MGKTGADQRKLLLIQDVSFWAAGAGALSVAGWAHSQGAHGATMGCALVALGAWGGAGRWLGRQEVRRVHAEYEKKSMVDESTGVLSKSRILDALCRESRSAKRSGEAFSVVMVEAVNIMEINQIFDRLEGDATLAAVAMASQQCLRDTDYLGRSGGLIFCALLPETDENDAALVLDRISQSIGDIARSHPRGEVHVKSRLAACTWDGSESHEQLLARAEKALALAPVQESDGMRQPLA
jgi:diguanylate cyclase (GGDEF)-like protein